MEEDNQSRAISIPRQDDFQIAFSRLPDYVQSWMCSNETAQINADIIKKYGLPKEKVSLLASLMGDVFFKEIILEKLPEAIQRELEIDYNLAKKIAIDEGVLKFLPIREYLKGIENAILSWGGQLPIVLPPKPSAYNSVALAEKKPEQKTTSLTQKSLRQIVQDNKEILNQILTASPLKIADFDQPVRGTIKNWLADYVKQKGAEKHDQMIRGDYLFKSDNTKNLSPQEKLLVAEILKSYDENSALTYDEDKKIIILENTEKNPSKTPEKSISTTVPTTSPPQNYREPIEKKDLPETIISAPKDTHQIDGRVINLKDLQ